MEFHFRRHFRLRSKMKNASRSASSIHHKKVLVLRCKVLVLVLNTRLGLGLWRVVYNGKSQCPLTPSAGMLGLEAWPQCQGLFAVVSVSVFVSSSLVSVLIKCV